MRRLVFLLVSLVACGCRSETSVTLASCNLELGGEGSGTWLTPIAGPGSDIFGNMASSPSGGVVALARVGFSVMVGGTPVSVPEGYEFLVTRIGPNGESGFAVPLGGARAAAVVGGPSGTFIVGTFAGGVRLGERRLTGDHASDHFVARLDANGGVAWLKAYGPAEIFTSVPSGALSNEGASC